jgi:hypothetical protein
VVFRDGFATQKPDMIKVRAQLCGGNRGWLELWICQSAFSLALFICVSFSFVYLQVELFSLHGIRNLFLDLLA